jgi:hypothetical protein
MWSIYKNTPPDGNPYHSGQTIDSFHKLRTNSGQTIDQLEMVESITNISVQPFVENNSGQTQGNSGQTQDSLLEAESVSVIGVQPTVGQTQDTQDSFFTSAALSPAPVVTGNEIKSTDLNFGVLSCPEFEDEAHSLETVGISEDLKTQDSCQKNVLSCPEFKESVLSCPEIDGSREAIATPAPANSEEAIATPAPIEIPLPIYQRSDGGFEVSQPKLRKFQYVGRFIPQFTDLDGNVIVANPEVVLVETRRSVKPEYAHVKPEGIDCEDQGIRLENLKEVS